MFLLLRNFQSLRYIGFQNFFYLNEISFPWCEFLHVSHNLIFMIEKYPQATLRLKNTQRLQVQILAPDIGQFPVKDRVISDESYFIYNGHSCRT